MTVFGVAFLVCFISAMFSPALIETDSYSVYNCDLQVKSPCLPETGHPWASSLNGFEPENRFLFMSITPDHDGDVRFSAEVEVSLSGKQSEDDDDREGARGL